MRFTVEETTRGQRNEIPSCSGGGQSRRTNSFLHHAHQSTDESGLALCHCENYNYPDINSWKLFSYSHLSSLFMIFSWIVQVTQSCASAVMSVKRWELVTPSSKLTAYFGSICRPAPIFKGRFLPRVSKGTSRTSTHTSNFLSAYKTKYLGRLSLLNPKPSIESSTGILIWLWLKWLSCIQCDTHERLVHS